MIDHLVPQWVLQLGYVQLATWALAAWFTYAAYLVIYRLCLSPLARFPGPRIAAVTHYYEFYYNCWLQGKYIYKIEELHEKYGIQADIWCADNVPDTPQDRSFASTLMFSASRTQTHSMIFT